MRIAPALLFLYYAAGCGLPPDITGVYRTTTHTEDTMGCGTGAPIVEQIFRIERLSFFGATAYTYELCTAPDPNACLGLGLLSIRFTEPTANGWTDDTYGTVASGAGCQLTHTISTATVLPGDMLKVQFQKLSGPSSGGCTNAEAKVANLPCVDNELLIATRVAR